MISVIVSAFLGASTYFDVKDRKIPLWLFLLFGAGAGLHMLLAGLDLDSAAALLPGLLVLGTAFCSRQAGTGDGGMLLVLGGYVGFWTTLQTMLTAMVLCVAAGLLKKLWKKENGEQGQPLAPCLLAAYWITLI